MNKYNFLSGGRFYDVYLSQEEIEWFGDRMNEGASGAVRVPTRLYDKFRKITGLDYAKNHEIKEFLITNAYGC